MSLCISIQFSAPLNNHALLGYETTTKRRTRVSNTRSHCALCCVVFLCERNHLPIIPTAAGGCLDRVALIAVAVEAKLVVNNYKLLFYFMHKEPKEETEQNPTLEDLRRELSLYDDEPLDDGPGWDIGKEESL